MADSFLQTELKQKRQSNGFGTVVSPGDEVAGGRSDHPRLERDVSDVGVGGRFNSNQIDASSCAKKSSGLKCIAKQVIDIIKTATCMSYP